MSCSAASEARCRNLLLATLTNEQYDAIAPRLHTVPLKIKQVLFERNQPPQYVYFPCTCVLSILAYMLNGSAVEVGTVGNEGFIGIEVLAGGEFSTETGVCQVEGNTLRMTVSDFKEATAGDTPLRRVAQRYMLVYLSLVSQAVACNRLHTIEERFARWILMTHDRVEGDHFYLTQEFIADMLGVHRPSVSLVASAFQQAGLIRYSRGRMSILNRQGLEELACECYGIAREQVDHLLDTQ
ncbi:Crp/Fnr family transcriptional regulator [Herbaspirillum sp. GCM10030257]|uniref:Crp/Fnr family transcriptional regulator n=1 Tax=Herbaspirillum sp. GCM10030257 TaxID=3273393 RepID=UPI00361B80EE